MQNIFKDYVKPDALCKYRKLDSYDSVTAVIRAITQDEIRFSSPLSFNDPFDCYPDLYIGNHERLVRKVCAAQGRHYDESASITEENMREGWRSLLQVTAISCFSSDAGNPIMWAHYADNHRGICLLYDTHWDDSRFHSFPVTYSKQRPKVDFSQLNDVRILVDGLCTKSLHWEMEKEHRIIHLGKLPGIVRLPSSMLKGIILGQNINKNLSDLLHSVARNRPGFSVFEAEFCTRTYAINNVLVSPFPH